MKGNSLRVIIRIQWPIWAVSLCWFKEIFRTAHSQMHNLSLREGTEEMTYYTSFNFQNKNGILLPNRYSSASVGIGSW